MSTSTRGCNPHDFDRSVTLLRSVYGVVHPEIWQPSLATFGIIDGDVEVGIAVTPAGSEHDVRFSISWERLSQNRALLDRYNAMKLRGALGDYEGCKSRFFDMLLAGDNIARRSGDVPRSTNHEIRSVVAPRNVT